MFSEEQLIAQLTAEGYEQRPYGFRKKITKTSQYIVIEPRKHTALGADPQSLNEFGLRDHPNEDWEHITHLGYIDGKDYRRRKFSLLYRFLDGEKLKEKVYKKDDMFLSVSNGGKTGYWHVLINRSNKPIKLFIEQECI